MWGRITGFARQSVSKAQWIYLLLMWAEDEAEFRGAYQSRSEWGNILKLPVGASCHCTAATGRSHSVQLILARACEDQSQCYHQKKVEALICHLLLKGRWYKLKRGKCGQKEQNGKYSEATGSLRAKPAHLKETRSFLLKCSHLTFLPNCQDPPKHMGGGDKQRQGFDLECRSLCKIWQGHSCLKRSNPPPWIFFFHILPSKKEKRRQLVKIWWEM